MNIYKLSVWNRLILLFKGYVFIRYEKRSGWTKAMPIYAFKCPKHGIQLDYPHGFDDRLDCKSCNYSLRMNSTRSSP